MIFVTVGTHEQPFNRLIKEIDLLVKKKVINEKVFIQTGFSTYVPKYCNYKSMLSYSEMKKKISDARIVITHGGPSSFIEVLNQKKIPIVVPRQVKYGEHINNHQVDFVKFIQKKEGNIIPVYNIEDLESAIIKYDELINSDKNMGSHNKEFIQKLTEIVDGLF